MKLPLKRLRNAAETGKSKLLGAGLALRAEQPRVVGAAEVRAGHTVGDARDVVTMLTTKPQAQLADLIDF